MAKIDLACAMLSFIVDTPDFEKRFLKGYGEWAEISVFKKLKAAKPNTAEGMQRFVDYLTDVEKRHFYDIINTPRFVRQVQIYGKDILNKVLKEQLGSQWKNIAVKLLREMGVKLPILFSPIMLNLGYHIFIYANQVSQDIFKVELDETKWKAFQFVLTQKGVNSPEDAKLFYEKLMNDTKLSKEFITEVSSVIYKEDIKKIKKIISTEQIKQTISKIDSLNNVLEQSIKNMETQIEN